MSGDSEQVTNLIWELLILNRAEGAPTFQPPTVKEVEGRKSKRKLWIGGLPGLNARRNKVF
jgi:hypothetical protein